MKRARVLRVALAASLFLAVASLPLPISGQEMILTETFDDPALPGWERSPNTTVEDGLLRIESGGFAFRWGDWTDLTLAIRARRTNDGFLEVRYGASDSGAYVFGFGNEFVFLRREAPGRAAELATAPIPTAAGVWVEVSVAVASGKHIVALDGKAVLTAMDPDPLPPGGVMLRADGGAVGEFDDLSLTATREAPPPAEEPQASPTAQISPTPEPSPVPRTPSPAEAAPPAPGGARGPAYGAEPWVRTGGPIGGLGYDVRYNFADHNVWYVTDEKSGLHMSTDRGLTWFPSNEGISVEAAFGLTHPVFCATVDPVNPNIVWVGTRLTNGIFKSTDSGHTWERKTNGIDPDPEGATSFRGFTIDPHDSNIVYAMAEINSWGWTPDGSRRPGLGQDMTKGVVYKTTDGGENWRAIWRGDNLARYCWVDPRDSNVIYVSTGIFDREAANEDIAAGDPGGVGVLKSSDGGETWRALNQENGLTDLFVGSLYMDPTNPDVLLAGTGSDVWARLLEEPTAGVYITEDGGEHWERVLEDEIIGAVELSPSDPGIAYAISDQAVHRSEDGGHTWQRFGRPGGTWGPPGIIAGFPIDAQCDPDDPMRVFVNNYLGGNFMSEDGGETWVSASKGYTGANIRNLAVALGEPARVYAGGRVGLFRSDNGGEDWIGLANPSPDYSATNLNEITALAVDPADPDHVLASGADVGGVVYSRNGGESWGLANLPGMTVDLAFAPSDSTIVYAALLPLYCKDEVLREGINVAEECDVSWAGLYVSRDGGESWTKTGGEQAGGLALLRLAVHPHDPATVYAARPNAEIVKTADGGLDWTLVSTGLPSRATLSLAIDPANPEVVFSGTYRSGVYRSTDGGSSWKQVSAGMPPEAEIHGLAVDPSNSQVVYAGDLFSGVYVSTDGGTSWRGVTDGLSYRLVGSLELSGDGSVLYAGMDGDGVYRLGSPPEVPAQEPSGTSAPVVEPSPTSVAVAPTSTPPEAVSTAPRGGGICPGAAALPLVLLGVVWISRRSR